jgi:dihydroorotase
METFLLKQVRLLDATSPLHQTVQNLLIANGFITYLGDAPPDQPTARVVEGHGELCVSPGWLDLRAGFGEPGLEHREDLASGCAAAAAGGYTAVGLLPNTQPPLQTKEALAYVRARAAATPVALHVIGAASADLAGEEMSEMLDLHHAGAVAFSDGFLPIYKTSLILKIFDYLKQFGGLFMNQPDDKSLAQYGTMHEGLASTLLGLPGLPALAEEMGLRRDLQLLAYTGGRLHVAGVSAASSLDLVRQAKAQGLGVTCDVASYHLAFTDQDLAGFDTNLKVKPPLRTAADQAALRAGLADGTIDAIVSAHQPHDEEGKKLEFDLAEFGMINLETSFALANTHSGLPLEALLATLTTKPRQVLGLPQPQLRPGELANLTLFYPDRKWTVAAKDFRSKARNTPLIGHQLRGRAVGVFNQGQHWLDSGAFLA